MKTLRALALVSLFALPASFALAASPSVSIQSFSPGASLYFGNEVSFSVVSSGFAGPLSYHLTDSLSGSSFPGANVNANGNLTWIPGTSDGGGHTLTVTVTDQSGNTASASQQVTVYVPRVTIY